MKTTERNLWDDLILQEIPIMQQISLYSFKLLYKSIFYC
jgi:hypothetical protein